MLEASKAGLLFYNTSPLDLMRLMEDQDHIGEILRAPEISGKLSARGAELSIEMEWTAG